MTLHRISSSTATARDSILAHAKRLDVATSGIATVESLRRAEDELAQLAAEAKALRMAVRQEIATAQRRERDDQAIRRTA